MKKASRAAAVLLALILVLTLGACAKAGTPVPASGRSLYTEGKELVALMGEMAKSDTYQSFYTDDEGMKNALAPAAAGNYTTPKAVYSIRISESALGSILELAGAGDLSGFSGGLRDGIMARAFSSLPTQFNAYGGSSVLAASSICTTSETFVSSEATENIIYLYTYETGAPAAVTFLPGKDNTVSATAVFILHDGVPLDSQADLESLLGPLGVEIAAISPN